MKASTLMRAIQTMVAQTGKDLEVQIQTVNQSFNIASVQQGTLQIPTQPMTRGTTEAIVLRV
jgi:hypothetical protein